jgi:hypothetical protein
VEATAPLAPVVETTHARPKDRRPKAPAIRLEEPAKETAVADVDTIFVKALKNATHSNWSRRLDAFRELQQQCPGVESETLAKHFELLATLLIDHCNDGNEKVGVVSLEALGACVERCGAQFLESYLARLLPVVLLKV